MFFKKKKKIEELEREIYYKQHTIESLMERIETLNKEKAELELNGVNDYDWAVLCKNYQLTVVNGGRIEEKVKKVEVEQDLGMIPTIRIEK